MIALLAYGLFVCWRRAFTRSVFFGAVRQWPLRPSTEELKHTPLQSQGQLVLNNHFHPPPAKLRLQSHETKLSWKLLDYRLLTELDTADCVGGPSFSVTLITCMPYEFWFKNTFLFLVQMSCHFSVAVGSGVCILLGCVKWQLHLWRLFLPLCMLHCPYILWPRRLLKWYTCLYFPLSLLFLLLCQSYPILSILKHQNLLSHCFWEQFSWVVLTQCFFMTLKLPKASVYQTFFQNYLYDWC